MQTASLCERCASLSNTGGLLPAQKEFDNIDIKISLYRLVRAKTRENAKDRNTKQEKRLENTGFSENY